MDFIVLILVVFALFIFLKFKVKNYQPIEKEEPLYRKLDALFTPAERSFLGVLNHAIDEKTVVFGKVRVADVITPERGATRRKWQIAFNKISAKHFDFILCNKDDLSVLCAIELDDRSHNSKKQKSRDAFLEGACKSASFPLIRVPAKVSYSVVDIREKITSYMIENEVSNVDISPETPKESGNKACPKCSSEMTVKIAKKGKAIGNEFWACSAFPKCRYIESSNTT
ncbi:DUF2726 domain-containing protein [Pseudoalteromonas denitrificans]|uniref:Topoisomerase DNA binding C4 zinc finger n=1 Tax=Pseudoalteromonas denitrificans DSM 6059 TaxID=1123010 RepID=A0A1I1ET84_9GAMM|nr:DUF2726 domain-containing protein [Pseudoalteromonas denitrificans]SFB90217.1 Topoisomerase DNA binding C4 zinc finger [Pseudoalteromonas denitrificans DSM 6059]